MTMVSSRPTSNLDPSSSPHTDVNSVLPHSQKCTQKCTQLEFSLPSEEVVPQGIWNPCKKLKKVYTTVGVFIVVWTLI